MGAWVGLSAILVWAVPPEHIGEVNRLVSAPTLPAAAAVLDSWEPSVARSFSFLLGYDFLYDLVHNNAVALLVVWGARRARIGWAEQIAWLLWLDTALNVFENLAFLQILRTADPAPLFPWAASVFYFRSATLIGGLVAGVLLHVQGWRVRGSTPSGV